MSYMAIVWLLIVELWVHKLTCVRESQWRVLYCDIVGREVVDRVEWSLVTSRTLGSLILVLFDHDLVRRGLRYTDWGCSIKFWQDCTLTSCCLVVFVSYLMYKDRECEIESEGTVSRYHFDERYQVKGVCVYFIKCQMSAATSTLWVEENMRGIDDECFTYTLLYFSDVWSRL